MQLEKVKRLLALYEEGKIPTLAQHEVNPGLPRHSRENYLYFTLPVCINFQRSSPAMWAAALATYRDEGTRYLFFPERLAIASIEQIRTDLTKYRLALQPNKHTLIWARQQLQRRCMTITMTILVKLLRKPVMTRVS